MIKRNSTAERMKLAQEIKEALLNSDSQSSGMVMSGIYTDIRNPYLMQQAVLESDEALFVASGILTHEEYKSFSGQDAEIEVGPIPGSMPSEGEQPPRDQSIG